jgi:hypothetical protein
MARVFAILAAVGISAVRTLSADTNSEQLTVGVTVARSCAVDSRPAGKASRALRLTCTAGAHTNLRLSESLRTPGETVSGGLQVVTLNF